MKTSWLLIVAVILVWSCQKNKNTTQEKLKVAPVSTASKLIIDTTYSIHEIIQDRDEQISKVRIGNTVYQSTARTYSLNDSALLHTSIDTIEDVINVRRERAHSYVYSVKLSQDGKVVYDKKYTRPEFYSLLKEDLVMRSAPLAPQLRGVTNDGRVVFELAFVYPESDVGMMTFFTTDLKGNLLQMESLSTSEGCYSSVAVSKSGKYFITCTTLYGPNGYEFSFQKPNIVHAEFLTDTSFVAIYDIISKSGKRIENGVQEYYEERDSISDNLIIYHVNGKKLASYKYHGYFQELGYTVPIAIIPEKNKLILIDDGKQNMLSISLASPSKFEEIKLSSLKRLNKRLEKGQNFEHELYVLGKKYFIYFFPEGIKYYVTEQYSEYEG
ncbi:hypothetical protein [Nibribacter koreensis]|uniref:Lipoprotein n=1 Tax=Nibribacter koreensis TaxID=1084519 RepID=A0ABP8FBX8_9BACT